MRSEIPLFTFKTLALLAALVFSGCAARRPISQGPPIQINRPALNEISEAEVGDSILVRGKVYKRKGILLKSPLMKVGATAQPGFYTAVSEDAGWIYLANLDNLSGAAICVSKSDNLDLRFPAFAPAVTYHLKGTNVANFDHGEIEQLTQDAFKQELVYNGRSGENVKFLYRELFGNAVHVPFSQDFEVNLNKENAVHLKGAHIEILDATSTRLRYLVKSGFDQQPSHFTPVTPANVEKAKHKSR